MDSLTIFRLQGKNGDMAVAPFPQSLFGTVMEAVNKAGQALPEGQCPGIKILNCHCLLDGSNPDMAFEDIPETVRPFVKDYGFEKDGRYGSIERDPSFILYGPFEHLRASGLPSVADPSVVPAVA